MRTFVRATEKDAATILRIGAQGRAALAAMGLDQWSGGTPTPAQVARDVAGGWARLALDDGVPVGIMSVCAGGERDYDAVNPGSGGWLVASANDPADGDVRYLVCHRVAVAADARRRGVARYMYQCAVKEARAAGMASVRVDTHAGNVPMQRLLVSLGFRHCCDVTISNDLEPTKLRLGYELVL
ncbi:GNAT family N-acetyltransferase [bacterium]|nr:GNAT family N-acetyltransferase [bacterium]